MVIESLSDAAQAKNYDMILSLTRMLPKDKNWLELDKDDVERQVVIIMKRHSDNGKETNTTSDHKRFLKIWFRFLKLGSRKFKKVGDPTETRDIVSKSIDSKITRLQLISPDEKKKLVDIQAKLTKRSVNEGFSGGEKKKNEIFQMAMLEPTLAILDETDSGLDIDALKVVANGINTLKSQDNAFVIITHYQRLLEYIVPDFVHVMYDGRIVKSGGKGLAFELEERGYDWIKEHA